jgi:hypothetical protein
MGRTARATGNRLGGSCSGMLELRRRAPSWHPAPSATFKLPVQTDPRASETGPESESESDPHPAV